MKTFKDATGRSWNLSLSIGAVARVRSASDKRYDLLEPTKEVDGKPLFELLCDDLIECWQVIWHLVEPQAKAVDIAAAEFGETMEADCLLAAQDALLEEWADFFRLAQRPDQAAALGMIRAGKAKLRKAIAEGMVRANLDETQAKMEAAIETACGQSFGNLRGSLDSILGS